MALYKAAACSIFVQDAAVSFGPKRSANDVTDHFQITANMLYSGVPNVADFIVGSVLVNLLLVYLTTDFLVKRARSHV